MGSKRYLVLGSGVGKAIAYMLTKSADTGLVAIGDNVIEKAVQVCRFIDKFSDPKCIPILFDADKTQNPITLFKNFDVVISALPARYNLELAKTAIKAKTHFCDLGGVVEVTNQMIELNQKYPNMSVSVVPDCGLMPGLGIIIAKKLMHGLDSTESIEILVGGIPQKPQPPIFYQKVFSPEGLKHISYDQAPILVSGKIEWVPPYHDYKQIYVNELKKFSKLFQGRVEIFDTAGASIAPWSFKKWGVKYFAEKTVRWPGYRDFFKNVPENQFEKTVETHVNIPVDSKNPDLVWMRVTASGKKDGFSGYGSVSLLDLFDQETGLTAMQRTTGFTTAIIAEMIAEGKTKSGVNTPENAFDGSGINEILDRVSSFLTLREN